MTWHYETEIVAIAILLILLWNARLKLDFSQNRDRGFVAALSASLLFSVIDLSDSLVEMYSGSAPLIFVFRTFYYLTLILPALCWFFYLLALIYSAKPAKFKRGMIFGWLSYAVFACFVFSNIGTHHLFWIDGIQAVHGPLYSVNYVFFYFYLAVFFLVLFTHVRAIRDSRSILALILLPLILFLGMILENLLPGWEMLGPCYALALLIAYLFVQNKAVEELMGVLAKEAESDSMTGLANRATFEKEIRQVLDSKKTKSCYLLMVDIDGLKAINDNLGHPSGDKAISLVAQTLRDKFIDANLVARIGGDEFAIIITNRTIDEVTNKVLSTVKAFDGLKILSSRGSALPLTCSIGVAYRQPGVEDFETIYHHSDVALYSVKRSGKSSYAYYDPEMEKVYQNPESVPGR
jgi:diguanylate cyclase (GGDEF)-like protein